MAACNQPALIDGQNAFILFQLLEPKAETVKALSAAIKNLNRWQGVRLWRVRLRLERLAHAGLVEKRNYLGACDGWQWAITPKGELELCESLKRKLF